MFIFCARKTHIHLIVLLFLYNLIQKENYYTPGLITVLQKVKLLQLLVWFFLQKFSLCVKVLGDSSFYWLRIKQTIPLNLKQVFFS